MKKVIIFITLFLGSAELILAQPTQADLDKVMKQLQERIKNNSGDTARMKALKDMQAQQLKMMEAAQHQPANNKTVTNELFVADPGEYSNVDNWKFSPKNMALLSSLPKRIFTKPELLDFLNAVYLQLSKKLPAGINSSVQSIAAKNNNDGDKMGDAAVTGWYTNYREEALLLIIKAASNSPDNGLLLNNCAAILNMGGIEQTAIPILKYLLQFYPGNPMVLNNLGQAYAGLGETDTAMYYLGRCIKAEPENPEANNTAGQIEAAKGNTGKAISYFEQSVKGAYNKPAELKLHTIKKGSNIVGLIRPRVKIPEYFNMFKYKFPAQCTNTHNATGAEAEYSAFQKTVNKQKELYLNKYNAASMRVLQTPPFAGKIAKDDFVQQPFYELCGIMARDVGLDFPASETALAKKFEEDYKALDIEYNRSLAALRKTYKDREDAASKNGCCGEGNVSCCVPQGEECKAEETLANQWLPKFAQITEDRQEKEMVLYEKYIDEQVYWNYLSLHPLGDDRFFAQGFYPLLITYFDMMVRAGTTKIIKGCDYEPDGNATYDSLAIKNMECPFDIEIPFVVGKFALNCSKVSFSGGEGAVFSYSNDFKTHQSTVSVGIGVKLELGGKAGPIKAGVSAGVSETLFITFDGKNGIADAGVKFDASAGAGITGSAGTDVKVKTEIANESKGVGYTVGINSGWNFNEGPFKGMIGPAPEVQLNKNVIIYKPNH